jgi:hypothetical protein
VTIDPNRRNFIDEEALELVGLVDVVESSKFNKGRTRVGSLAERPTVQDFKMSEHY